MLNNHPPVYGPPDKYNTIEKIQKYNAAQGGVRPPTEQPPPALDTYVHRLRFLKLVPRAVVALAAAPDAAAAGAPRPPARVAVAREGGAVELVSPQDRWVVLGAVPGVRGRKVDALAWVCGSQGRRRAWPSPVREGRWSL